MHSTASYRRNVDPSLACRMVTAAGQPPSPSWISCAEARGARDETSGSDRPARLMMRARRWWAGEQGRQGIAKGCSSSPSSVMWTTTLSSFQLEKALCHN
ncbi:hypothetical protein GQ55_5G283000 [Panicum hallii var. hallii]|uniref:Uncharacterized protein n=1 Tax=Panicum hallii var. hallii TaxID=1504633 RepID=A0A2T7DL27_9POAL|nr:hypothetical protein GQ55_5G283000 [Panicum hallii var. hallii]